MTALDVRMIPRVFEMVQRLGKPITFHVLSGGSYDPSTRRVVNGSETLVDLRVTPPQRVKLQFQPDATLKEGDAEVYLPAQDLTFEPTVGWPVTIDSVMYAVVKVEKIYSGEQVALWRVVLRNDGNRA